MIDARAPKVARDFFDGAFYKFIARAFAGRVIGDRQFDGHGYRFSFLFHVIEKLKEPNQSMQHNDYAPQVSVIRASGRA